MTPKFKRVHEYDHKHHRQMVEWTTFMPPRKQVVIVEGDLYCDRNWQIVLVTGVVDGIISYVENGNERHCMYKSTFCDVFKPVVLVL